MTISICGTETADNLLGLPAIRLLYRLNSIDVGGEIWIEFPKVFSGLGNLGDEYHNKLKEGTVPHALYTPRNVPIPLHEKVKEELAQMEAMGVISPIQEPTPWCAGMVVVSNTTFTHGPQRTRSMQPAHQAVLAWFAHVFTQLSSMRVKGCRAHQLAAVNVVDWWAGLC